MTYTSAPVAPPAPLPWDLAAITAGALDVLRLEPDDDDADRIAQDTVVATARCEQRLDYVESPWETAGDIPAPVVMAATNLTVELYRRKDAPFGVTDAWSVDGAVLRLSSDVMRGVDTLLAPYRSRRGVA